MCVQAMGCSDPSTRRFRPLKSSCGSGLGACVRSCLTDSRQRRASRDGETLQQERLVCKCVLLAPVASAGSHSTLVPLQWRILFPQKVQLPPLPQCVQWMSFRRGVTIFSIFNCKGPNWLSIPQLFSSEQDLPEGWSC